MACEQKKRVLIEKNSIEFESNAVQRRKIMVVLLKNEKNMKNLPIPRNEMNNRLRFGAFAAMTLIGRSVASVEYLTK